MTQKMTKEKKFVMAKICSCEKLKKKIFERY